MFTGYRYYAKPAFRQFRSGLRNRILNDYRDLINFVSSETLQRKDHVSPYIILQPYVGNSTRKNGSLFFLGEDFKFFCACKKTTKEQRDNVVKFAESALRDLKYNCIASTQAVLKVELLMYRDFCCVNALYTFSSSINASAVETAHVNSFLVNFWTCVNFYYV